MLLVTMVLVMIMVVVSISGRKLREKIDAVSETQTRYERLLQEEEKRKQDIEEFGKYMGKVLAVDTFFLNEDRHTHNLAVLLDEYGEYH